MKKISVIVPCYNAENYIDRCVLSLVSQTMDLNALEYIFVNDASTDKTLDYLRKWEKKYPNTIIVIDCHVNHRTGGARNVGIKHSTGEYIGFMDNDDTVEPDMYESLYEIVKRYHCDVVACLYERVSEDGRVYPLDMPVGKKDILVNCRQGKKGDVSDLPGEVWNKIYHRDLFFLNDLFFIEDLSYTENYWEPLMWYYIHSYYVIDRVLYHHIVNSKSIMMSDSFGMHEDRLQVEVSLLEELERRGLEDISSPEMECNFICRYYINTLHLWFSRNSVLDYAVLRKMQKEILTRYPNYLENENWISVYSIENTFLIATISADFSNDMWKKISKSYQNGEFDFQLFLSEEETLRLYITLYGKKFFSARFSITNAILEYLSDVEKVLAVSSEEDYIFIRKEAIIPSLTDIIIQDEELEEQMKKIFPGWSPGNHEKVSSLFRKLLSNDTSMDDYIKVVRSVIYELERRKEREKLRY